MPICTLRAPYERFHGKVISNITNTGQVIYSSSKSGNVSRAFVVPDNPESPLQILVRGHLADCASAYSNLTKTQAATWTAIGAEIHRQNILETDYVLSGIDAYCSVNVMRILAGVGQSAASITVQSPGVINALSGCFFVSEFPTMFGLELTSSSMPDGSFIFGRVSPKLPNETYNASPSECTMLNTEVTDSCFNTVNSGTCNIIQSVDEEHQVYGVGNGRVAALCVPMTSEYLVGIARLFPNELLLDMEP